jgi:hypothetical protein
MSRLNFTYKPLASFAISHWDNLIIKNHFNIFPNSETAYKLAKMKLKVVKNISGLIVLYRKSELFTPIVRSENYLFNDVELTNDKVIGYESKSNGGEFINWLPNPADVTLTFYGIASAQFKLNTSMEQLQINEYLKYDATALDGEVLINNDIKELHKPEAIFEINISNSEFESGSVVTKQFNITTINN